MIDQLNKLSAIPGVRFVMLVTKDGVPIASPGIDVGDMQQEIGAHGTVEALAAVATGWLGDLELSVAPMSWRAPRRVVMKGSRGSLVMTTVKHSVIVVLVAPGLDLEPVCLSIDGTARRMDRGGRNKQTDSRAEPRSLLPRNGSSVDGDPTTTTESEMESRSS